VKTLRFVLALCAFAIGVLACTQTKPQLDKELPLLPTANVPSVSEIDTAIERWNNSHTTRYFVELDEQTQEKRWIVRLVVADGVIRTAQRLEMDTERNWREPANLAPEEAQTYTVDAILERVRKDALGDGPVPVNLRALFDPSLGFPKAVHAEALPVYTEEGNLLLDRQYSYDLTMQVKALLEDSFVVGKDPIYTYIRSGGPQAWCDTLRIFPNGSSVYTDDCRDEVFQLTLPGSRQGALESLRSSFASLDDLRVVSDQMQRLIILGTGEGTPDAATSDAAWELATEIHEILSEPVGLGLTMVYLSNGDLIGFNVLNKNMIPADLKSNGNLRGAVLSPDGKVLAFSEDSGLSALDMGKGEIIPLLDQTEGGYYLPRAWSGSTHLLLSQIPPSDGELIKHGWISPEEKVWHELPLPGETPSYGCDTGAAWSPISAQLAITGLGYAHPCNMNPGLNVVDVQAGTAQRIVAPAIRIGDESGGTMTAGAHTPAWSPDGTWIAFGLDQDALAPLTFPTRLYRVHPDGSNLTPITNNSQGLAAYPVWAQDGSLYYSLSGGSAETDGIYRYTPAENRHDLIIPGSNLLPLSISTDAKFMAYAEDSALKLWSFRLGEVYGEVSSGDDLAPSFVGWVKSEK